MASELSVIMKAKDLCQYVMLITERSPKKYRFTFTVRLQNLAMGVIEALYLANETFVSGVHVASRKEQRLDYQHSALTQIKLLAYFAQLALEQHAILPKQYHQIALQTTECQRLIGGWIKSDRKRYESNKQPKQTQGQLFD